MIAVLTSAPTPAPPVARMATATRGPRSTTGGWPTVAVGRQTPGTYRSVLVAGALLAVLAACDGDSDDAAPAPSSEAPASEDPVSTAPARFLDRAPLPACPPVELRQGQEIPPSARGCLDAGREGDGAELVVTAPTAEGIPITTYHRWLPGAGGYESFTDMTPDAAFGSGAWEYHSCPQAVSLDDLGACSYSELS
jgi:hypothetical protein